MVKISVYLNRHVFVMRLGGRPDWSESSLGAHVILLVLSCADSIFIFLLFIVCSSPLDIDLFTGVLSEEPVEGGNMGPTLDCLIGDQFQKLKYGDRFWYQGDVNGFTAGMFFF